MSHKLKPNQVLIWPGVLDPCHCGAPAIWARDDKSAYVKCSRCARTTGKRHTLVEAFLSWNEPTAEITNA